MEELEEIMDDSENYGTIEDIEKDIKEVYAASYDSSSIERYIQIWEYMWQHRDLDFWYGYTTHADHPSGEKHKHGLWRSSAGNRLESMIDGFRVPFGKCDHVLKMCDSGKIHKGHRIRVKYHDPLGYALHLEEV